MRLGIDVRQADQQIRSTVVLPAGLVKLLEFVLSLKDLKLQKQKCGADFAELKKLSIKFRRLV